MEVNKILAPIRQRWWLVLLTTVLTAVSSYLVTSQQPPYYQTSSVLMIGSVLADPNPSGGDFVLAQQLAATYSDIAQLPQVRQATMENLGLRQLPQYEVTNAPNTQLVNISVTDTSPARAVAVANELAKQLVERSPAASGQESAERQLFINQELDDLETRLEETKTQIGEKQDELAEAISAGDIDNLNNQISALESKRNALQTNYASLLASSVQGASNTISVIQPAIIPGRPAGPNVMLNVITTTTVGFMLVLGSVYVLDYLDDSIKSAEELAEISGLPRLAVVPKIKGKRGAYSLITLDQPDSVEAEVFRKLRTRIVAAEAQGPHRRLLISSANPGEGKSLIAANLGVILAKADFRVLLIDADLRRPVQHAIFNLSRERGLSSLLTSPELSQRDQMMRSEPLPMDHFLPTQVRGLFVLPSGPIPDNPSELLGSAEMSSLITELSGMFDYILLDTPSALAVTDGSVLGTSVDGVLLVMTPRMTRRADLERTLHQFHEVNAKLIGIIGNRMKLESGSRYYYRKYARRGPAELVSADAPAPPNQDGGNGRAEWWEQPRSVADEGQMR